MVERYKKRAHDFLNLKFTIFLCSSNNIYKNVNFFYHTCITKLTILSVDPWFLFYVDMIYWRQVGFGALDDGW